MRKKKIIIACVLVFILAICLSTSLYAWKTSRTYEDFVRQMEQAVREEVWERAQAVYAQMEAHWDHTRPILQLWIRHQETDEVSQLLLDLKIVLDARLSVESLRDLEALYESVRHLYHRDAPTLPTLL